MESKYEVFSKLKIQDKTLSSTSAFVSSSLAEWRPEPSDPPPASLLRGAVTENTDQGWRSRKEGCRHVPSSHCISWRRRSDEKPRMAQFVRRPEALGAVYLESQRNKSRTSYFCNVKSRLGSKLPAGVSQPPQFAKPPWKTMQEAAANGQLQNQLQNQPVLTRPLDHIPHIRNPKLRQYYLQGTSWDFSSSAVAKEPAGGPSRDRLSSRGFPENTVFSVASESNDAAPSAAEGMGLAASQTQHDSSATFMTPEQLIAKGLNKTSGGGSQPEPHSGHQDKPEADADHDCFVSLTAQPHSPSQEADYDKLLDVEAVPLPDGQLCLLALPPELCEGEGPEAMSYLKLFGRHITDRKGVVSGILLVTSSKIFFDPFKKHPLVKEHGCEEYFLSCSIDNLASVSFFSDSSHVHFNTTKQRKKEKNVFQRLKNAKSRLGSIPKQTVGESLPASASACPSDFAEKLMEEPFEEEEAESRDMAEVEQELDGNSPGELSEKSVGGLAVLSSAASLCCGGQEEAGKASADSQTPVPHRSSAATSGWVMFVRLRVQPPVEKKGSEGLLLGGDKTSTRRDAWLALSQESSDELHAYLKRCRPDLCIIDGEEEGEADHDEEGFVLIEGREGDEEEAVFQRRCSSADDWEMVLKMEDSKDKQILASEKEPDGLSLVVERSQILEESHVRELNKELPARTVGHSWQLTYSTSLHGASLKSLYRKLGAIDSPVLIVIKDSLDEIFGAFLSHPLRPSETFYGTGETFLFMLHPRFKCFKWTGENSFFIKGDLDCFAIGGGSGHFGLWVDESLYVGRSSPCYTFNNCCLSETADFHIMELEVWTFS
ncbi:oxidation resistance protein 1-like isoform X3 [Oryzias latipes]|uniref:oxidation resistance protein 1-like isoform X3 n=1 Tax=Oryzias latipes TaxID=8090 RepID=UPI0009DAA407|nr:oxidation resistance protein 1-like isoform X3 [Oryzias latipes]